MLHSVLHSAAVDYARAGYPIHRILPNSKLPAGKWKDEATTDLDTIHQWYAEDDWNIGFCPEKAGLCVVDLDPGADTDLYSPCQVATPRGRHLYFAGSLPPTASKIAPHVDTRGRDSYVLLPPSVVDGKRYEECWKQVPQPWELPEVPEWVVEKLNFPVSQVRNRLEAIKSGAVDRPQAIKLFKRYLQRYPIPPEGEGSDDGTYRAIARARDLGLSDRTISDIILDCYAFDVDWLQEKIENVEKFKQNEDGCDTPETGQEKFGKLASQVVSADPKTGEWTAHRPRHPDTMPKLDYYDSDKCIPKSPDGAIGILYGRRGEHKTNTILSMLDMATATRILYAAGEGAYGVERDRIAARPSLAERIWILPRVPLFSSPEQVRAFIDGNDQYKPEIVVLDTLATAIVGEDEQSAATASYLTDNGPAGMIKRAWGCTVIVIAHAGKDVARGVRGSSGFEGNVDFVLLVEADKKNAAVKLTVTKMRDGYDGFSTYWQYETGQNTVPVPARITEAEYMKLTVVEANETNPVGMVVTSYLGLHEVKGWLNGELADALTDQELGAKPDDVEGAAEWDTIREQWRRKLLNARGQTWAKRLFKERVENGGTKMITRWYSPEPEL